MIRVRFIAPRTGFLTVAAARVALANAAFARSAGGALIGRVANERAEADLRWLGVTWDEPGRAGDLEGAIARLKRTRRLYPCFESDAELHAKQDRRLRRGQPAIYDRAMLALTDAQRAAAEAGGKIPHWRFRLSDGLVRWTDPIAGPREAKLPAVSDPVTIAADGTPSSTLTAIVADIADRVTHVVRTDEGDGTTGVHLDLLSALGQNPTRTTIAQLPGLGATGRLTIRDFRRDGIEAEALAAWLGTGGTFAWPRLAEQPDPAALPDLNRAVLSRRTFADVADRLPLGATEPFWLAIRGHIDLLNEARHWWDVVSGDIFPDLPPDAIALLPRALAALPPEPWGAGTWTAWCAAMDANATEAALLQAALTGEARCPDLGAVLPLMGRARALTRLSVGR
jgi:glutamyl-tRNA synthetase